MTDIPLEMTPAEAHIRQSAGSTLIDVREPGEWAEGTPIGALRIPLAQLLGSEVASMPHDTPLMTICRSGGRSMRAVEALRAAGYRDVMSVCGGFTRWKREGLPFEVISKLDADARQRYARHLVLPDVGEAGQVKLGQARVTLIGAGGLGSPIALYLAAAGVGFLRVVDDDRIERSNLQRQVLHTDDGIGSPKVESARASIAALNPRVVVEAVEARALADNVESLVADVDLVIDGADNLATRYLLNDACAKLGKPLVYGAVHRFEGQVSVFDAARGPCYRCLFPEPPSGDAAPNCAEAGVLGVLPGTIGLLQATEALKLILGIGEPLIGRLMAYDALAVKFTELRLPRDPECRMHGGEIVLTDAAPVCRTL